MASYYVIKNYARKGNIGIADKVFEHIVSNVLQEENVSLRRRKNVFQPRSISVMRKESDLRIAVGVNVVGKARAGMKEDLEEKIATTIYQMTELMPTKVSVKIEEVSNQS